MMEEALTLTADQEHLAMVFCEVTEADLELAKHILDANDWQLKTAFEIYYDGNAMVDRDNFNTLPALVCLDNSSNSDGPGTQPDILTVVSDDDIVCMDDTASMTRPMKAGVTPMIHTGPMETGASTMTHTGPMEAGVTPMTHTGPMEAGVTPMTHTGPMKAGASTMTHTGPMEASASVYRHRDANPVHAGAFTPETSTGSSTSENLSLITWNVDGLDENRLPERTKAVADIINQLCPDIVMLQEVVDQSCVLYRKYLPMYKLLSAKVEHFQDYYTCILLRNISVKYNYHYIDDFTTMMLRNLLVAEVMFGDVKLHLLTAHFESTKAYAKNRQNQFNQTLDTMMSLPWDSTVIYGGDTNLRDTEVMAIGGLPSGIRDVWIELGSEPSTQYTWDLYKNNNLSVNFKARNRFDRLFMRGSDAGFNTLSPCSLELIGTKSLACKRFPSDHWGLLASFKPSCVPHNN